MDVTNTNGVASEANERQQMSSNEPSESQNDDVTLVPGEVLWASWAMLAPHAERGALFLVLGELDARCGVEGVSKAAAEDDSEAMQDWLEKGLLRRPNEEERAKWDESPIPFQFAIAQPYVFAAPRPDGPREAASAAPEKDAQSAPN